MDDHSNPWLKIIRLLQFLFIELFCKKIFSVMKAYAMLDLFNCIFWAISVQSFLEVWGGKGLDRVTIIKSLFNARVNWRGTWVCTIKERSKRIGRSDWKVWAYTELFTDLGKLNFLMVVWFWAWANFHHCPSCLKKATLNLIFVKFASK